MSSLSRRYLLLAPMALAACGFTPAYGPGGGAGVLQGAVRVDPPVDPNGFALVRQLEQRLGRLEQAAFRLAVAVDVTEEGVAVTAEQETTRIDLLGSAAFELFDLSTGELAASGTVRGFTGYSTTGSTVSIRAANTDAERRLMIILADKITTQLIAAVA